jgi:hypothetical protein
MSEERDGLGIISHISVEYVNSISIGEILQLTISSRESLAGQREMTGNLILAPYIGFAIPLADQREVDFTMFLKGQI